MDKVGIVYYTDGLLPEVIARPVQTLLLGAGLPIVSVSLKPMNFGKNIVIEGEHGYGTMLRQIITALTSTDAQYVFFAEHDILYHKSHFDFIPTRDDAYYFNTNVYRWNYPFDRLITYDHLVSLSGLCCNRNFALRYFEKRFALLEKEALIDYETDHGFFRKIGYEPKPHTEWHSRYPNIDIRHDKTFTRRKCTLEDFVTKPTGWKETQMDKVPGWNLKESLYICYDRKL